MNTPAKFSVLATYHKIIEPLRDVARERGYCLAVHGSLARDIDIVAIPWVEEVVSPYDLVEDIRAKLEEMTGGAAYGADPQPEQKPNGRLAWSIYFGGNDFKTYVDISVTPISHDR